MSEYKGRGRKRKEEPRENSREGFRKGKSQGNKSFKPRKGGKPFYKKKDAAAPKTSDGSMRLNRYLAHAGIASRREADTLIASGVVKINGKVVTELGTKVMPGDKVIYGGELISNEKKQYVLLNKPKDYITTVDDPQKRRTVMDLVGKACKERIYPVGRLDRATSGVLLLTNDGELTQRLTHPSSNVKKIYTVGLDKKVSQKDMHKLVEGVELEDGTSQVDKAYYFQEGEDKKLITLELHSGKNRIIRRMMESLGYKVLRLDRVQFAGLTKKNLLRGRFRHLSEKEIGLLHRVAGLQMQENS